MSFPRALIIGAGIAGPVTAMALQRAGLAATVYEAYPAGADAVGAWLSVAVNGLDALRTLDLAHLIVNVGFPSRNMRFVSGTGKRLGELPIGGTLRDGTVTHTMKRADLYRALYAEAIRRGIRIEHGKRLVDAEATADGGVMARFADDTTAQGDCLIGADGLHSRVRTVIDPAAPGPRYLALGNVGGVACGVAVPGSVGEYEMLFGKHAFFAYVRSPSGEIWWFAHPPSERERTPAEIAAITAAEWCDRLRTLFSGDRGPAAEIVAATRGAVFAANQYDVPAVPHWSRGPMLIIGDAAHAAPPSAGQGASMAIEDAVTVAKCLRDLPDVPRAFAAYEAIRRPRVAQVLAYGARASQAKVAAGPIARMMRDLMMPRIFARYARAGTGGLAWLYEHHIDWDARVHAAAPVGG